MFLLFSLICVSCQGERKSQDIPNNNVDTALEMERELEVIDDPSLWSLGGVESCVAPREEVSYQNVSQSFGFDGQNFAGAAIEGGMGLRQHRDQWWLWQVVPQNAVEARTIEGQVYRLETEYPLSRLYIFDINQDGMDDLLILGEFLEVVWAVQTEEEYREVLLPMENQHGVRDVGLFDIEGDGDLDLWVFQDHPEQAIRGFVLRQEAAVFSTPELFAAGNLLGAVFEALVLDWDNDGDPDLYVCNDFGSEFGGNSLLENEGGLFIEGDAQGADIVVDCMGVSSADMDRDGLLDLYVAEGMGHTLLKNTADGFVDVTLSVGLLQAEHKQMLWGSQIIDYNNDGWFDILVGTSDLSGFDPNQMPELFPVWLFEQTQKDVYQEVGMMLGLPQETLSRIILARDINQDGIQDLFISSAQRLAHVFVSDGCTENSWLEIETPADSLVRVFSGEQSWLLHSSHTPGMAASMDSVAHIGLGAIETVDRIEVQVPWRGIYLLNGPITARQRISLMMD